MMRLGARISADWINRPDDLKFLKQIGIDYVDIILDMVPGYDEAGGRASRTGLRQVIEKLDAAELKIERANTAGGDYLNAYLGKPEGDREIENIEVNADLCGEFGIPIFGIQCFQAAMLYPYRHESDVRPEGRGGYRPLKVRVKEWHEMPLRDDAPTSEELWETTLNMYSRVLPIAESHGMKMGMHGNDPPMSQMNGVPQIMHDFDAFDRLFKELPSPSNGMTFCVGTRYESGQDIFEGIKRFADKIVHVHFRNVQGIIPQDGEYLEVMPDEGDLNMYRVAKALHDIGYDGVIDYDHLNKITTDSPQAREYMAYCVGHMRGILQSLEATTS